MCACSCDVGVLWPNASTKCTEALMPLPESVLIACQTLISLKSHSHHARVIRAYGGVSDSP